MEKAKRYYWLKLKDDFFTDNLCVKKLQRMKDGAELTLLYLKLLTHSLKDDGILFFQGIEENLAEELALDFDVDAELMGRLIDFLIKYDLLVDQGDDTFLLVEVLEATGSETRQAGYMRKKRNKSKKVNKVTNDGNNVTHDGNNVTQSYKNVTLEIRDKSLELIKEVEEKNEPDQDPEPQPQENIASFVNYQSFVDEYHRRCPSLRKIESLTPKRKQRLKKLLSRYTIEQIMLAFDKAQASAILRGECNGKGYESFLAGFDWIINENNFVKILEGKYDSRSRPSYLDRPGIYESLEPLLLEN